MSNNNRFLPTAHPIWGIPMHMNVSDLSRQYQEFPATPAVNQATVTTKSAQLNLGANAIQVRLDFQSAAVRCDLNVYTTDGSTDTLVYSRAGIDYNSRDSLFVGNLERVALDGLPIKVEVANPTGGWVTAFVRLNA